VYLSYRQKASDMTTKFGKQKVRRMILAVGSMLISSLTKHDVGWAEWTVAKLAGSSFSKTAPFLVNGSYVLMPVWHKKQVQWSQKHERRVTGGPLSSQQNQERAYCRRLRR
jgi:hypothetical protein